MSASIPFLSEPLFIFNIFEGLTVNISITLFNFKDSLWNNSRDKGNNVSTPIAPVAAWANGNLLDSSSSGLWSDTITSINPFLIPSTNANLSFSDLNGGESLGVTLDKDLDLEVEIGQTEASPPPIRSKKTRKKAE